MSVQPKSSATTSRKLGRAGGGESSFGATDSRLQPKTIKIDERQIMLNIRKIIMLLTEKYVVARLMLIPAQAGPKKMCLLPPIAYRLIKDQS
jgi:hypothetical protein